MEGVGHMLTGEYGSSAAMAEMQRCFDRTGSMLSADRCSGARDQYPAQRSPDQRNSTAWFIASATTTTPSPVRALVASMARPSRTVCFLAHAREIDADMWGEIGLVDHQHIAANDARPALARNVVAAGDINHEHPEVGEVAREGGGEIVAAALQQDQLDAGEPSLQFVRCLDVERRILAYDGVRTGARLDRRDARGIDQA